MRLFKPLKGLWNKSQTKVWSYIQLGGSAALLSADQVNKVVSNDTFRSYLDQLDVPKSVIIGLAVFGMITFLVHGHGDD